MKVFVASHIQNIMPEVIRSLQNIGVDYTSSVDDTNITHTIHCREVHDNLNELIPTHPELLSEFGGDVNSYVRSKNSLPVHAINHKDKLALKLQELNLPYIDTLYPTTLGEIQDFFDKHGSVFCKPAFGEGGGRNISGDTSITNAVVAAHKGMDHLYRPYTSYDDFITHIDVDVFLQLQNDNNVLASSKAVFQPCYDITTCPTILVMGCINGSGEILFYPPTGGGFSPTGKMLNNGKPNVAWGGIVWEPGVIPSDEQLMQATRDPNEYDVDRYGVHDIIKTLFTASNIKNTTFLCQLVVIDGVAHAQDISFKMMFTCCRWQPADVFEDHLKFMLDMQPKPTKFVDTFLMPAILWSPSDLSGTSSGFTPDKVAILKSNGILPLNVFAGRTMGIFGIIGSSKADIISKYKTYMERGIDYFFS